LLAQWGNDYRKFGPYNTSSDEQKIIDYDSIELRFMQNGNVVRSQIFDNDTDAIVLTLSAYDKFFQSYYTRLYGANAAADFRSAAQTSVASLKSPIHKGGTLYKADTFQVG